MLKTGKWQAVDLPKSGAIKFHKFIQKIWLVLVPQTQDYLNGININFPMYLYEVSAINK